MLILEIIWYCFVLTAIIVTNCVGILFVPSILWSLFLKIGREAKLRSPMINYSSLAVARFIFIQAKSRTEHKKGNKQSTVVSEINEFLCGNNVIREGHPPQMKSAVSWSHESFQTTVKMQRWRVMFFYTETTDTYTNETVRTLYLQ